MFLTGSLRGLSLAVAVAATHWASVAESRPPLAAEGKAMYAPIQSISHEFGSKFMSGYFVPKDGNCHITLMVTEMTEPDQDSTSSPTRIRLALAPGQAAGFDSEEGRTLNISCGHEAKFVMVQAGGRNKLLAVTETQ